VGEDARERAPFDASGRRIALAVGLGVLTVVGIALLVGRLEGYSRFLDELRDAEPVWLAVCLGAEALSFVGYAIAFRAVVRARGGPVLDRLTTVVVVLGTVAATRLLAAAGAGGLAFTYWVLRRAGLSRHEAIVRVLALNVVLYAVFGAFAFGSALAVLVRSGPEVRLAVVVPWLVIVPACVAGAIVLPRSRVARAPAGAGRMRRGLSDAIQSVGLARELLRRPRPLAGAILWWAGDVACLWAGLRAFGETVPLDVLLLAYATGTAASFLPLPMGGVGGVEAAMTFALHALGVPLAPALLGVVAYRFFNYWLPTLPALVVIPALTRLPNRLEDAGAASRGGSARP
jgi:uncharacterized membrane protein YbhN (UPF0104 family)